MKEPKEVIFYRKLAAWMDGADVSASSSALRFEGDRYFHKTRGDLAAVRTDVGVYYRMRGIAEAQDSCADARYKLNRAAGGTHLVRALTCWDPVKRTHGVIHPEATFTWPKPTRPLIPCPPQLMGLLIVEPLSIYTVDLATRLERARVQQIIRSRSKTIRKDGKLPYFLGSLAGSAEARQQEWTGISLSEMNDLRARFGLAPMDPYDSPIPGLKLADLNNLASLAK